MYALCVPYWFTDYHRKLDSTENQSTKGKSNNPRLISFYCVFVVGKHCRERQEKRHGKGLVGAAGIPVVAFSGLFLFFGCTIEILRYYLG